MMVQAIGIDAVEIKRFTQWQFYSAKKLQKIFHQDEIDYCLENSVKSAERFAVRFAAKEALYKALSSADIGKINFFLLCKQAVVQKKNGAPYFEINWNALDFSLYELTVLLSLSHTRSTAIAMVMLQSAKK